MSMKLSAAVAALPPRPFNPIPAVIAGVFLIGALFVLHLELSVESLEYALQDIAEYFSRYGQPDFSDLPHYLYLLLQTLATALWGSAIAFVGGFVLAPLAARNLTPNRFCFNLVREFLSVLRATPDLLLALFFVAAIGLGPLPGTLALGLHTMGFLAKFMAEGLERVPAGTYEGVRATGAGPMQVLFYAGWPSISRETVGYALYILDRNVRMSSVLGLVGAGGIGQALYDALRLFQYGRSAALIVILLVTIVAIDALSGWARQRLA
ncbi:MAG TPA: phosphonate ABC transporter, permease protein PhnE [Pseudomonas sp.]|jgi:phosphonate transport system permease protein|nr:phosphonate ABC transporter, permease protein PhnE [Pseudomonas sp.]